MKIEKWKAVEAEKRRVTARVANLPHEEKVHGPKASDEAGAMLGGTAAALTGPSRAFKPRFPPFNPKRNLNRLNQQSDNQQSKGYYMRTPRDPFPFIDPRPDVKVVNPITEFWPSPVTFSDEPTPTRSEHRAPVTNWYIRKKPIDPVLDPWNAAIEAFIDYLTGTEKAPSVALSQHSDDMPEYGAHGYDSTITTFEEWDLDGDPIEPALPAPHGWTIQTEDAPLEVAA